jgi:hypothetical protein
MGYQPIESYGIIDDVHSMALVGTDWSIDWLCFPNFDSPDPERNARTGTTRPARPIRCVPDTSSANVSDASSTVCAPSRRSWRA